ncbi:hypothetical protein A8F94_01455 [Bacillus sp. FJAT-27225]|uniref:hypothetical protein n=1 Tax=Bacillus sp. FJAT-27225 TaxID=1743144 RepID=UPI00080C22DB|nr:hypothetical protein [Bacillus sp. FJAT-27225]OCA90576.1 hypothetical protein A8F94_01455 [Bacillus sp. FJAT-27225]
MLLWYVALFFIALVLGFFQVSVFLSFMVIAVYIVLTFPLVTPLFWSKDTNKMMKYIKKSHNEYFKFLYRFLNGDLNEAETIASSMKKGKMRDIARVMLLIKNEQFSKARELLEPMKDSTFKYYYLAASAQGEGKFEDYQSYKNRVKDQDYRKWLEIEELVRAGKKTEAGGILEAHIAKLRGTKLLSAVHFRSELKYR